MLDLTIVILLSIACVLFLLSFFRKDRTKELEKQIEDMQITYMQELYLLKKKIRRLEEELLISHQSSPFIKQAKSSSQQQLLREVVTCYEQGDGLDLIANKTGLTISEVEHLLAPYLQEERG
ncbi:hypothetical protein GN156_08085 [bacterium LRH843]|nr:hypothetical protein [bacterium LRH843]